MALHRARQTDAEWLVESFNGRLRDECLNEHLFTNLNESRQIIEAWRDRLQHQPTAHEPQGQLPRAEGDGPKSNALPSRLHALDHDRDWPTDRVADW
jgi:hypothetical protein